MGQRFLTFDQGETVGVCGQRERPFLNPTDGLTGLCFELAVEIHRILNHAGKILRRAQRAHLCRGMPGRPGGKLVALQQDCIGPELGQVIER